MRPRSTKAINKAAQHRHRGRIVSFWIFIVLCVVSRGEHISKLKQLTYTQKEFRCKQFLLSKHIVFHGPYFSAQCPKNLWATSIEQRRLNGITWASPVSQSAITMIFWKPHQCLGTDLWMSIVTDSTDSTGEKNFKGIACFHKNPDVLNNPRNFRQQRWNRRLSVASGRSVVKWNAILWRESVLATFGD